MRTWAALDVSRLTRTSEETLDLLQAALLDYQVVAVSEVTPDTWHVFFHTTAERDRAAADLARQFDQLSIVSLDVDDEDWVGRSQAGLRAVRVGGIVVAPPWDIPSSSGAVGEPIVIVIRPSMGFGTAHHATTRLCLAALQRVDVRGLAVVDVGTGSGVLAIAASRLGAARVAGVDDDPDALAAARDNLTLNGETSVDLQENDARSPGLSGFDVVLANLTGALLATAAQPILGLARPGGTLVLSGLLEEEEASVLAAYAGCLVHHRAQEGEWLCLSLKRP